jgi:L-arabinose isomerase
LEYGCGLRAWADAQGGKIARFGDNMREVAVTKVIKLKRKSVSVILSTVMVLRELVNYVNKVSDDKIENLSRNIMIGIRLQKML